jgi:cytoskeletal protein RodZ
VPPPGNSASSGDDSPFAPTHALNPQVCTRLGAKLRATRDQRGWTHAEVANRLLLSTAQVSGLERADASAFHNPAFFAVALRKYTVLMAIDFPEAILTPKSPPILREPVAESTTASESDPSASRSSIPMWWLAVAAIVLIAGALALALYFRGSTPPSIDPAPTLQPVPALPVPPPAAIDRTAPPLPETLPAPAPTSAQTPAPASATRPAPAPATTPDPPAPSLPAGDAGGRAGVVTLARPAWVFVRYADNSVIERVLQAGQSLTLTSAPIYIAIGTSEGVTLTLRGRPIDVTPFRTGDEIRIRAIDLAMLARAAQ